MNRSAFPVFAAAFFVQSVAWGASSSGALVMRLEQETRLGGEWLEVTREGSKWKCRGTGMRGVYHSVSPVEGWTESVILGLESKQPCARPAKIILPKTGAQKKTVSTCTTRHAFEELWAQVYSRCRLKF